MEKCGRINSRKNHVRHSPKIGAGGSPLQPKIKHMLSPTEYRSQLKSMLLAHGNHERALAQMQYLRNQFEFYGLKAPELAALSKAFFKENGLFDGEQLKAFARLAFEDEHREVQYVGLQMVERQLKKQSSDFIVLLEELITTKSWWDSVDWCNKLVGLHFKKHPDLILPITSRWMDSGNFWLQRVCLIFQLTYREKTDFELLKKYILALAGTKEFFLQKGAGWALRQYAKTAPEAVRAFVLETPQLAPLTKREALKGDL